MQAAKTFRKFYVTYRGTTMRDYGKRDPSSHRTDAQVKFMDSHYNVTHMKQREERNQARAYMRKKLGSKAIAGKDVNHIKRVVDGGTNAPKNLNVQTEKKNRGWERDA